MERLKKEYKSSTLGTALPRWSHAEWTVLNALVIGIKDTVWLDEGKSFDSRVEVIKSALALIPCPTCKFHADKYNEKNPPVHPLKEWLFNFHNAVSARVSNPLLPRKKLESILPTIDEFETELWNCLYALSITNPTIQGGEYMYNLLKNIPLLLPEDQGLRRKYSEAIAEFFPTPGDTFQKVKRLQRLHEMEQSVRSEVLGFSQRMGDFLPPNMFQTYGVDDPDGLLVHDFHRRTSRVENIIEKIKKLQEPRDGDTKREDENDDNDPTTIYSGTSLSTAGIIAIVVVIAVVLVTIPFIAMAIIKSQKRNLKKRKKKKPTELDALPFIVR